jgi:hypothetical protein
MWGKRSVSSALGGRAGSSVRICRKYSHGFSACRFADAAKLNSTAAGFKPTSPAICNQLRGPIALPTGKTAPLPDLGTLEDRTIVLFPGHFGILNPGGASTTSKSAPFTFLSSTCKFGIRSSGATEMAHSIPLSATNAP